MKDMVFSDKHHDLFFQYSNYRLMELNEKKLPKLFDSENNWELLHWPGYSWFYGYRPLTQVIVFFSFLFRSYNHLKMFHY